MDPTAVVLSALSLTGTTLQAVGAQAVKDCCARLRELLVRKFGATSPRLERTLVDHAQGGRVLAIGRDQTGTIYMADAAASGKPEGR